MSFKDGPICIWNCSCHTSVNHESVLGRILPNYIITYIPILVVMITNPILYKHSVEDMKAIITCTSGQFTSREREILEAIKLKFAVINLVFYVCWLPNLINGCLLWTLAYRFPWESVVMVWYIMVSWRAWKLVILINLLLPIGFHKSSTGIFQRYSVQKMEFRVRKSDRALETLRKFLLLCRKFAR